MIKVDNLANCLQVAKRCRSEKSTCTYDKLLILNCTLRINAVPLIFIKRRKMLSLKPLGWNDNFSICWFDYVPIYITY